MKPANSILRGFNTTVFEVMTRLAVDHQTTNLRQIFQTRMAPTVLKQWSTKRPKRDLNQYTPMLGIPVLRQAVTAHNNRFYNLDVE